MTKDERVAISILNAYKEGYESAIEDYKQEPCDKCKYFDGNSCQHYDYKVGYTQGYEDASNRFRQQPCDDAISIRKDVLKCRVGKLVVYNVEWLKKHWQMEMDIVCGVKPCDDAINPADRLLDLANAIESDDSGYWTNKRILSVLRNISSIVEKSVTQKSGKWIYRAEDKYSCSKCGTTTRVDESGIEEKPMYKFCPYCGAKMVEPQESEDKE